MKLIIDIDENVFTRLFDNGMEDYAIVNDDLFAIAKSIRKGTPLEPTGHWIPVSERLPDGQTEVIVSILDSSGDTEFDYTSSGWVTTDGEYWIVDNEICNYVIAWMPLPKPFEPQESEEI